MNSTEFCRIMDSWADEEAENARMALEADDERGHSIALMKESMYRTMLKTIGQNVPEKLALTAAEMAARAENHRKNGDHDRADRCLQQRACIERVMKLIGETEAGV